jgi:hypothetical protein
MSRTEKIYDVEDKNSASNFHYVRQVHTSQSSHTDQRTMFTKVNCYPQLHCAFLINFKLCCIVTIRISMRSGLVTWAETKYLYNTKLFSLNCLLGLRPNGY